MTTQSEPVEEGALDSSTGERIAGVIDQTRQDLAIGSIDRESVPDVLRQRLHDAQLDMDEPTFERATGDLMR